MNDSLIGWIPYKFRVENNQLLFHWLYTADKSYTEPFFDATITHCCQYMQNSQLYKQVCNADMIQEWAEMADAVRPSAFIFHVSRCGSTLVSQALGLSNEHISLSEVPLFDDILRLHLNHPQYDEGYTDKLLTAAITLYGTKRTGKEKKMFIKADSWHLMFYQRLRSLYPDTPFIIMYRNPHEVLLSNQHKKGMQSCYGLIHPQLLGLETLDDAAKHPDIYMSLVLEKYFEAIINNCANDNNCLLLNYNQGINKMMEDIADFIQLPIDDDYKKAIAERSSYHAKYPHEKFKEPMQADEFAGRKLDDLNILYERINVLREHKPIPTQ